MLIDRKFQKRTGIANLLARTGQVRMEMAQGHIGKTGKKTGWQMVKPPDLLLAFTDQLVVFIALARYIEMTNQDGLFTRFD